MVACTKWATFCKRHFQTHFLEIRHLYFDSNANEIPIWRFNWYYVSISSAYNHDDIIKWKHFPRYWPFVRWIHRSPVDFPHAGQWREALVFSLIYAWTNGWANNRDAGDLRQKWPSLPAHMCVTRPRWVKYPNVISYHLFAKMVRMYMYVHFPNEKLFSSIITAWYIGRFTVCRQCFGLCLTC